MTRVNVGGTALALYNGTVATGGATVDAVHPDRPVPTTGYAVSVEGHEWRITLGNLDASYHVLDAIEDYVRHNRAILATLGHYAGAWKEGETLATLDVTRIIADKDDAIAFGKANHQRAIFDLANGKVITLDYKESE